ncbi:MAG: hypothetical protein ACW98X_26690 [Promethearchaeota archaeon]|jgi:hypothetical protein
MIVNSTETMRLLIEQLGEGIVPPAEVQLAANQFNRELMRVVMEVFKWI